MAAFPTSPMRSAGTAATREADTLSVPITWKVQPLTLYVRFVDFTKFSSNTTQYILALSDTTRPLLTVWRNVSGYQAHWETTFDVIDATTTDISEYGELVELLVSLSDDGTVTLQTKIGNTVSTGTDGTSAPIRTVWGVATLYLGNLNGTAEAGIALNTVLIERGVHAMDNMRRLAGL